MARETHGYDIREYIRSDGGSPFREWLDDLPVQTRARIQARVARMEVGNLGDVKAVGSGVLEARIHFGPGYRVYLGIEGAVAVILLCGGDKGSQAKDVRLARRFWQDYRARSD